MDPAEARRGADACEKILQPGRGNEAPAGVGWARRVQRRGLERHGEPEVTRWDGEGRREKNARWDFAPSATRMNLRRLGTPVLLEFITPSYVYFSSPQDDEKAVNVVKWTISAGASG